MHLPEPILVFDIGGTKVAAAVLAPDFTISQRREIATLAMEGPERVAVRIVALGREVLAAYAAGSGVQALPVAECRHAAWASPAPGSSTGRRAW